MIDLSRARKTPYKHQTVGVEWLSELTDPAAGRVYPGCFLLGDEMGAGKTKQCIDVAQVLFERGEIDTVIVIAPGSVRPVWFDQDLGELKKHLWEGPPGSKVTEYRSKIISWSIGDTTKPLRWFVTNYEFIRQEPRLEPLFDICGPKTWLILDESSAVKNHRARQTKACLKLRRRCGRVTLLNGMPIDNSPKDMYSQGVMMDPRILACRTYFHFRARYAVMGGFMNKQIVNWRHLDDLQRRFAPYVKRRLKKDCLDLPPKLDPVALNVPLTEKTWDVYKEIKDEFVAWLDEQTVAVAPQAAVRSMRLSQITAGFLGGVHDAATHADRPPQEIGREKLDLILSWLNEQLLEDPNLKLLLWCRFRPELKRLYEAIQEMQYRPSQTQDPRYAVGVIWGAQKKDERIAAMKLLKPGFAPPGPVIVCGTTATGSLGLDLASSHTVIYLSNDYSLKTRKQSEDRVHRPGQTYPVSYFDVIATGPKGQRTIDHVVIKALRAKEDVATWTTSAWVSALKDEE